MMASKVARTRDLSEPPAPGSDASLSAAPSIIALEEVEVAEVKSIAPAARTVII